MRLPWSGGLFAHLPPILNFLWRELLSDFPFFMACFFWRLGFAWLWLFFLQPTLLLFSTVLLQFSVILLCYSYCDVIWPKPTGLLWACCLFFSQWLCMIIGLFITLLAGSRVPFISSWASLAYLLSLGILGHFSNSAFPWAFTNSFGLPRPNFFILHPWGSWTFHQPLSFFTCITSGLLWSILTFLHHKLPMDLLLLTFQASLGPFASSRPICLFYGHMIYYFCYLGLMAFLST